ncbi:MAG: amidohydrolase family protein [Candidatus Latescibacteria bacterium]|nr:amidohydrolase family protein [Candidatus Latescibacterota bacterium]
MLFAQDLAITGGRVVTVTKGIIENGTVIVRGGTIAAIGQGIPVPAGVKVIDARGLLVYPGMIDPNTTVGLVEVPADRMTDDTEERTKTNTAAVETAWAIASDSEVIPVTRVNGITTVMTSPGTGNPIDGLTAIINLNGRVVDEMLVKAPAGLVFSINNSARRAGGAPPGTRPGIVAMIRQELYDAQEYIDKKTKAEQPAAPKKGEKAPEKKTPPAVDLNKDALGKVLKGEIPAIFFCREVQEIRAALHIADEFKLKAVLLGADEADPLLDEIKSRNIPILFDATYRAPSDRQPYDYYFRMAGRLEKAGVTFAFTTSTAHQVRNLPYIAAQSVAYGLSPETALRAVTITTANILGVADRLGSLEAGKVANIVVWDGDPLQIRSHVKHLIIAGKEVPLDTRQTWLRDRYQKY